MATDFNTIITNNVGRVFTFSEAVEFMKILDNYPTMGGSVQWVNAKTKEPVVIGYVGCTLNK